MKRLLLILCACSPGVPKGAVSIDVSALRQAQTASGLGELDSLGLLVVRGKLATLEDEQAVLDSDSVRAEAESATPSAPATDTVPAEVAPTESTRARETTAVEIDGALAAPKIDETVERVVAEEVPLVSYYPITLDPGASTFSIELPAGRSQNMFLIGFARKPDAAKPTPTYVSAALDVTLNAQEETSVVFGTYPAGLAIPQFLPPTTLGLRDRTGALISEVPRMSCLAVASASRPRPDFPPISLSRINVGSVSAQLEAVGAAGLFVLPVGTYEFNCFAAFEGKLFAVDPKVPLQVDVKQGEVTLPTASLVKIRDLTPVEGTPLPTGTTQPSGSTPPASVSDPHFSIDVLQPAAVLRQLERETTTFAVGGGGANFNRAGDGTLVITAVNADGSLRKSSDHVRVSIRPAFGPKRWGIDALTGEAWKPFDLGRAGFDVAFDTTLIDGTVPGRRVMENVLRFTSLQTLASTGLQFLITVQAYDADNRLGPRVAARYITVTERGCDDAQVANAQLFTLTEMHNTLDVDAGKALGAHVLLAAVGPQETGACAVPIGDRGASIELLPQGDADKMLALGTQFQPVSAQGPYLLKVPATGDSQGLLRDAIRASDGFARAGLLGAHGPYVITTRIGGMFEGDWTLNIRSR